MRNASVERRYLRLVSCALAFAFLIWAGFIAVGAGFIGALLNCGEDTDGCDDPGFPSLIEPWTWGRFDVFPEVFFVALAGLASAGLFVVFVLRGARLVAAVTFALALALLSYPFFAGLTDHGRALFAWGLLLGLAAVVTTRRRTGTTSAT